MIKNNFKGLVYFGLWYFILVASVLLVNFRGFVYRFMPPEVSPILVYGIATLVFSILFALLFLEPQGDMMSNFTSIASVVILDIGIILAVAVGVLFHKYSYTDLLISVGSITLQLLFMLGIMRIKKA